MENEKTRTRVNEIYDTIKKLEEELEALRSECSHDSYEVVNYSFRPGNIHLARVCTVCGEHLGYPNDDELEYYGGPGYSSIQKSTNTKDEE